MATNIQNRFGITVAVNRDIPKAKYLALQSALASALAKAQLDPNKVKIYIHHIAIQAAPIYSYHKDSISAKLEKLNIRLTVLDDARRQEKVKFLNHEIGFSYQSKIEVQSKNFRMEYTLPGDYCEKNREFDDYVAVLVDDRCPEKFKRLTMSITAHPTSAYKAKISNIDGIATTKIVFPLSQDIQLTF